MEIDSKYVGKPLPLALIIYTWDEMTRYLITDNLYDEATWYPHPHSHPHPFNSYALNSIGAWRVIASVVSVWHVITHQSANFNDC